jgi:energy-converting hydrogenase Eha subunit G
MHFQEIPSKIMERFPAKPIKVNTVHNELVKNNQTFVNMGLGIYGLKERGFQGGVVKEIIVRILSKFARPMSVKEISKELLKEKMVSPNTVLLNLQKYKDLFVRTDKGIYSLVEKKMTKKK